MGGPAGARCTAPNCLSTNKKGFSMFRYPKDETRKAKWLAAIGRTGWNPYQEARLCELHFSPLAWNQKTLRLKEDAEPLTLTKQPVCSCGEKDNTEHNDHSYAALANEDCNIHGKRSPHYNEAQSILKENCELQKRVHQLQEKVRSQSGKENASSSKPNQFSPEDVRRGLQLRFACGSAGYKKLRTMEPNSPYPSIRLLQAKTQHIKFAPGLLEEVLEPLKAKFQKFTDERDRDINIVFDELATKKRVDFDVSLNRYIGYGTMPGQQEKHAKKGEIYVFRAIRQKLKQIVCYHLNPPQVATEEKKSVIISLLTKARDMGANVIALVCDMGNRGLLSTLGFSTAKDSLKWCIPNPVKPESKLWCWCVPDPVHVFKSMKEGFCKNKFIELPTRIVVEYGLPSSTVSVEHIEWLEQFQSDDGLQLIPGLSIKDIQSSHFSKMKVSSSTKIVNNRTAAALQYLAVKNVVPEAFETTAWFLKLMNRWFVLMTSRSLQVAFGHRNEKAYEEAIQHLKLVIFVFKFLKIPGGWKPVQSHIIFATHAILEIQDYLLHDRGYQFVLTGSFTTAVVENINSCVRITNPNPTPLQLKNRLKHLAVAQFQMKINSSSYNFDGSEDFVDLLLQSGETSQDRIQLEVNLSELKWISEVPSGAFKSHEEDVLYRLCGYIVVSLKKKKVLSCDSCIESLRHTEVSNHRNSLFLKLTDFVPGAQFAVIDNVFQICRLIEYNLKKYASMLRFCDRLDFYIDAIVQPGLSHIQLPTCHNIRQKLVKGFCTMRLKQISVSHFSPSEANSGTSLSSKTVGGKYLAENFMSGKKTSQKRKLNQNSSQSLKRLAM